MFSDKPVFDLLNCSFPLNSFLTEQLWILTYPHNGVHLRSYILCSRYDSSSLLLLLLHIISSYTINIL